VDVFGGALSCGAAVCEAEASGLYALSQKCKSAFSYNSVKPNLPLSIKK
jgi:hypothetical protein